jgi:hypothetical protein
MMPAARAQYWDAFSDDEFERYERRQRFIAHFAGTLNHRQAAVLGAIAEQCWDRGCCSLSVGELADEALVSVRTVYNALRSARELGLIRDAGGLIRMIGPKWQALLREQEGGRAR